MICKECGSEMLLDDTDFNFNGNYDEYWVFFRCSTSCVLEFRFAKPFKEIWHSEYNDNIKDYVINYKF